MAERPKKRDDADFFHDVDAAHVRGPRALIIVLHVLIILLIAVLLIWAYFTELEQVVQGPGRVIPHGEVQPIHHARGGILREVSVEEGAVVERDQVILRLAPEESEQMLRRRATAKLALRGRIERLNAEIEERPLVFSDRLNREAPDVIRQEQERFAERMRQFEDGIAELLAKQDQAGKALRTLRNELEAAKSAQELVEREISTTRPRVEQGIVPKANLDRLTRESGRLLGELRKLEDRLEPLQEQSATLKSTLAAERRKHIDKALVERDQARAELAAMAEQERMEEADAALLTVRAPFRGKISRLPIRAPGARVAPGALVAEMAPLGSTLLIEAHMDPRHMVALRPGLDARVRLSAYETVDRGGLAGQVESIDEAPQLDSRTDQLYYRVLVRTAQNVVEADGRSLPVSPGMVAEVNIRTGQRSLLALVVDPLIRRGGEFR